MDDAAIFNEELTPEEERSLRAALASDPDLALAFSRWEAARSELRRSLDRDLPDRSLLVLYALDQSGDIFLTAEEQSALEHARPSLEAAFEAHPFLHDVIHRIQEDQRLFDDIWERHFAVEKRPEIRERAPMRPAVAHRARRWVWRVSALAAVLVFAALSMLLLQRDLNTTTVATGPGEVQVIELADGSTVRLMESSQLEFVRPDRGVVFDRRVRLEGRAFFDVAPGQEGFAVETRDAIATVLGTSFGMTTGEAGTEVVLATGRLALAPSGVQERMVVLESGQMSRVAEGALPTTPVEVDLTDALEWTGVLFFRAEPLSDIAERLGAYYGVEISVAPTLAAEEVFGDFVREQEVDEVLETISSSVGGHVVRTEAGYAIEAPAAD